MIRARAALGRVIGVLCAGAVSISIAAEPSPGDEKLRQLLQRARSPAAASQADRASLNDAGAITADRLAERTKLLTTGEGALARLDVSTALEAFDRAALILHAADTEIALVRTYMQGGEYRRALAFGAHTAGAHLDVIGGSALYAWLLHAGGQGVIAQRLLHEAEARTPGDAFLGAVQAELKSGAPVANGKLLSVPTRLAPYGPSKGIPSAARVLGSGLLLADGTRALVPLTLLPRSGHFWLRNGLGRLARGTLEKRLPATGLGLVRLENPMPHPETLWVAGSAAFPGSVAYAVEYVANPHAAPAWPVLRTGFLGMVSTESVEQKLGIDMPAGPRGGPVFDAAGRLIGVALPAARKSRNGGKTTGQDRLIPASLIQAALSTEPAGTSSLKAVASLGSPPPASAPPRVPVDRIYELSLWTSLQLIGVP